VHLHFLFQLCFILVGTSLFFKSQQYLLSLQYPFDLQRLYYVYNMWTWCLDWTSCCNVRWNSGLLQNGLKKYQSIVLYLFKVVPISQWSKPSSHSVAYEIMNALNETKLTRINFIGQ